MAPSNKSKRPTAKKLKQTLVSDFLEKVTEGRVKKEGQADTRSQQQADKGHVALQHLADDHEVDTPGQPQAESAVPDNGNGTASQPTSAALAGGDGVLTTQTAAASHPPRGGSRKRKRPAQRPILLDGGPETVGSGEYTVTVSVKILQEQSSVFFSGPIPAVDKSTESIRRFRDEASQYAVIQTSTVVRCADGKPVLYFIKGGMYASLTPGGDRELREKSISAIRELIDVYPPPRPDQADSRMQAEQRGIQGEKNKAFGRYVSTVHVSGQVREQLLISGLDACLLVPPRWKPQGSAPVQLERAT